VPLDRVRWCCRRHAEQYAGRGPPGGPAAGRRRGEVVGEVVVGSLDRGR
jgi:hypothetical protein